MSDTLTQERLRDLLRYDHETGHFHWRQARGRAGCTRPAGYVRSDSKHTGYRFILIKGCAFASHRLVWLYVHGRWPQGQIDHINGCRSDNRLCNLREVDAIDNAQNQRRAHRDSKTGLIGARPTPEGDYRAEISVSGKKHDLGRFKSAEAAHQAYVQAKRRLHASCSI